MDAQQIVKMALDAAIQFNANRQDAVPAAEETPDGVRTNADGTITVTRSFRLDQKMVDAASHPVQRKHVFQPKYANGRIGVPAPTRQTTTPFTADEALVPACDGKGHDTPLENCKAENPMFCPYHGIPAMKQKFAGFLMKHGLNPSGWSVDISKRKSGAFQISVSGGVESHKDKVSAAIADFIKQDGFLDVGGALTAPPGGSIAATQIFKQDTINHKELKPSDEAMLDEWMDSIYTAAANGDSVDFDDLTEMESKVAGLKAMDKNADGYAEKMADAQDHYHKMKAKVDFADIDTPEGIKEKFDEINAAFKDAYDEVFDLHTDKKNAMQGCGWASSPAGFPGNDEYNNAHKKIAKDDMKLLADAKAALEDTPAGDLDAAKLALHNAQYALDQVKKHTDAFEKIAAKMIANYKKCADDGISKPPKGVKGKEAAMAWYEKMGITIPEELKAIKAAVDVQKDGKTADAEKVVKKVVKKAKDAASAAANGGIVVNSSASDEILKPLAHDESKFPANVTQDMLDQALAAGKEFSNSGSGMAPTLVTIGGKQYVMKAASENDKYGKAIKNGFACDMAYRAGGIHAPDSKLYSFGGKVYKLAEYVQGTRLDKIMKGSDDAAKEAARKSILKGYPLDVLFSNWDVLGTNMASDKHFTNVIIDKDGNAYRIDNDGAFAATGLVGGKKNCSSGNFTTNVEYENWDEKGGWAKREWIDDFRTMRRQKENVGVFDKYTTADIFLAAGGINMAAAVASIKDKGIKDALKKPLFEMNQMATHAVSASISGVANNEMLSQALDTMYEASKLGMREMSNKKITWGNGGFGENTPSGTLYTPKDFPKKEPDKPNDPLADQNGKYLENSEYTGSTVGNAILKAAKTINYHAGFVQKDADGNALGEGHAQDTPDHTPNPNVMAQFDKIDREKLSELAKTDAGAKYLLNVYDAIVDSKNKGFTIPIDKVDATTISASIPDGFKTKAEIAIEKDKAGVVAQYKKDLAAYQTAHAAWLKEKQEFDDAENEKAAKSGKNPYVNFNDFADKLLTKGIDTDGIANPGSDGIDIIEHGKDCNKYGKGYHATTSEDSWTPPSSRLKILEHVFRGMTLDQILAINDNDPLINNGHHSSDDAKDWFMGAAKYYKSNPSKFKKDCRTYACWKGLQTLKLENESCDDVIHHDTHSVMLSRKEAYSGVAGSVEKVEQKAANTSCGFLSNGSIGHTSFAYDVPLWNVAYTYNDENKPGSKHSSHKGIEHEWVATLIGLNPYCAGGSGYEKAYSQALATPEFKSVAKKRKDRLAPFMTSISDILK